MRNLNKINREKIREIVRQKMFDVLYEQSVTEGIDFSLKDKTISYNPSHQNNVDTSVENNPTVTALNVNGCSIPVYSIFKRRRTSSNDGNPFIYAMKGERGWKFRTTEDEQAIDELFTRIDRKFANHFNGKLAVIVPTSSPLND